MQTKFIFLAIVAALMVGVFLSPSYISRADTNASLAAPLFSAGERIKAGGSDLVIPKDGGGTNIYSVPCVVDWNEDGKKDLLVGCFWNGYIYLYLNSGTNNAPVFTTGTKLKADGVDISVSYG